MPDLSRFHSKPCANCGHRDKHSSVSGCIDYDADKGAWCPCTEYVAPVKAAPVRAPQQRTRTTDPETSLAAAASLDPDNLRASQSAVLRFMRDRGPMTDVDLVDAYTSTPADRALIENLPRQSASGLRTRRAELVAGGLVVDTGERRRLESGRQAIVWAVKA
jgi:hypothetical protein